MKLRMVAKSDVGVARSVNEDFCGIFEEDGLAVVCDGMGGHQAGAKASRLAVSTLRYMYLFLDSSVHSQITHDLDIENLQKASRLIGSIRLSNRNIYNKSIQEPALRGMGTTVSALAITDSTAIIAHVGDSRIYRFRQDNMDLLTQDHTWVNELLEDQEIDQEEAKKFEKQNVITRALGLNNSVKIDLAIAPVAPGDLFLLCTDGLTKALSDEEIKRIVSFNKTNFLHTLQHLIDTANIKDGSDNITIALVSIEEASPIENGKQSTYLTLKAESDDINQLEDKVLKQELSHQDDSEKSPNSINKFFKHRYAWVSLVAGCLMLVILIGVFAASNQKSQQPQNLTPKNKTSRAANSDVGNSPSSSLKPDDQFDFNLEIQSKNFADSTRSNLITNMIKNQMSRLTPADLRTRSLQKNMSTQGIIYFISFEKMKNFEKSSLFVNGKYWGKTIDFRERGLLLPPGDYQISIHDSTNQILFEYKKLEISAGDIKPIEFGKR